MAQITPDDIAKLHLGERDILVVRLDSESTREQARVLYEKLRPAVTEATGSDRFPILICIGSVTLDCLNDQVIRELGWVRPEEGGGGGAG